MSCIGLLQRRMQVIPVIGATGEPSPQIAEPRRPKPAVKPSAMSAQVVDAPERQAGHCRSDIGLPRPTKVPTKWTAAELRKDVVERLGLATQMILPARNGDLIDVFEPPITQRSQFLQFLEGIEETTTGRGNAGL